MKIEQRIRNAEDLWELTKGDLQGLSPNLVFVFGDRKLLESHDIYSEVRRLYPKGYILLGSTSGDILDTKIYSETCTLTAVSLEKTKARCALLNIEKFGNSYRAGKKLAESLLAPELRHVFVLSDGGIVNGSELVRGLNEGLAGKASVTGGLAGDQDRFEKTLVGINENPTPGNVVGVGFYGDTLEVSFGATGGWSAFGAELQITKSEANVLYELDGKPALEIYKSYLGDKAAELPASGLLFPLHLKTSENASGSGSNEEGTVRTLLGIDEDKGSMTFAGDLPEGATVQLMRADFDALVAGAETAAEKAETLSEPELSILVSCVGRRLVLQDRATEELEVVRDIVGDAAFLTGFYSYGEICPFDQSIKSCSLHNQTMTITNLKEK